jgi:hypothetical protein
MEYRQKANSFYLKIIFPAAIIKNIAIAWRTILGRRFFGGCNKQSVYTFHTVRVKAF